MCTRAKKCATVKLVWPCFITAVSTAKRSLTETASPDSSQLLSPIQCGRVFRGLLLFAMDGKAFFVGGAQFPFPHGSYRADLKRFREALGDAQSAESAAKIDVV